MWWRSCSIERAPTRVRTAIDLFTRLPDEGLGALDSGGVTPRD